MWRRLLALLLLVSHLALTGCLSIQRAGSAPAAGRGGGIAVSVFPDDAARRAGATGPAGVSGELERREGRGWRPVFRSLDPAWAVAGLPPGEYRVRFPARLDEAGHVVRLSGRSVAVRVEEGRVAQVHAILEHVSPVLVAAGIVTVVVAAVLLSRFLDDHDLPEPPLPPAEVVELAFYITLDLASAAEWSGLSDRRPPAVTSHFPASNALVAARRPRVVFALSEPLRAGEVAADAVAVLGEASGLVPGQVSYDDDHWWVVWEPRRDLGRGEEFHVTLAAGAIEDLAGNEPESSTTFTFKTSK